MITKLSSYYISSYSAVQNNGTSDINYFFDIPNEYLDQVTHISVVDLNLPNEFYQIYNDQFILIEGTDSITYTYAQGNYTSIQNFAQDTENILNLISPHGFTYTVTVNTALLSPNNIIITVNDSTLTKQLNFISKHLTVLFGLNQNNTFINRLVTGQCNLYPVDIFYLHSNIVKNFNNSLNTASDIIASLNIDEIATGQTYSLKANMKEYNHVKLARFYITDYDNELISFGKSNFDFQICFFKYEESFIDKIKLGIEYMVLKDG